MFILIILHEESIVDLGGTELGSAAVDSQGISAASSISGFYCLCACDVFHNMWYISQP